MATDLDRAKRISRAVRDPIPPSPATRMRTHKAFFSEENFLKLWPNHVSDLDLADLKRSHLAIPLTSLYIVLFLATLAVTFLNTFNNSLGKQFLSLEGSNQFQYCELEPQPLTASFSGDFLGRWSTNPSFTGNNSIYELRFFGSVVSEEQYRGTMSEFRSQLREVGAKSSQRDYIWATIAWSTFRARNPLTGMSLLTNAKPNVVISDLTKITDVNAGVCYVKPTMTMTSDAFKLNINYPIGWPVQVDQINPGKSLPSGIANFKKLVFIKTPQASADCKKVCRAHSTDKFPLVCKAGMLFPGLDTSINPSLARICTAGSTFWRTISPVTGPLLLMNNKSCMSQFATGSAYETICSSDLFHGAQTAVKNSTFDVLCPCAPAYTEPCPHLWNIKDDFLFNQSKAQDPNTFPVSLDTRSLFLATAVNFGIVKTSTLQKVTNRRIDSIFKAWGGSQFPSINFFLDPEFERMTPIVCFDKAWIKALGVVLNDYPEYCVVQNEGYGGNSRLVLGFPIFTGTNGVYNSCKCPAGGSDPVCNNLDSTLHVLWFNQHNDGYTVMLRSLTALAVKALAHGFDGDLYLADAFNTASSNGQFSLNGSNPLCPGFKCFLMSFDLHKDELTRLLSINENQVDISLLSNETYSFNSSWLVQNSNFQWLPNIPQPATISLQKITCVDTIYQEKALDGLCSNPPSNLSLPYYKCTTSPSSAIISSFGSAAGITGLLSSAVFAVILYFIVAMANRHVGCSMTASELDGVVVANTRQRIDARLAHIEELLESLTEVAVTSSHEGGAFQKLIQLYERKLQTGMEEARPTSFDLASAYGGGGGGGKGADGTELELVRNAGTRNPISPSRLNPMQM